MNQPLKVISNKPERIGDYLIKVWQYRKLILNLTKRDLKVKYAQTSLGLLWVILQPLTGMAIFSLFFSGLIDLMNFRIEIPYYLFAYSGFALWIYFSYIVNSAGTGLRQEEAIIKKIYFPRLVIPIAKSLVGFVDFAVSILIMLPVLFITGYHSGFQMFTAAIYILLASVAGLAVAVWLAALTIRFRDFHHIIPFIITFGIWLTPVFYPATLLPEQYHFLIYLNPMAGITEGFRWALFDTPAPSLNFLPGYFALLLLLFTGILYFRRTEKMVADYL